MSDRDLDQLFTVMEHLDNLVRHISLVRDACVLLGKRLMKQGRITFGRLLIARGFVHDATKFYGIEWDYLHAGPDVEPKMLELAIKQHVTTNEHHPEYYEGFHNMVELSVAEMVCDWFARATEFGTGLRDWIEEEAITKYNIDVKSEQYGWLVNFVNLLLEDSFVHKKNGNGKKYENS